jgi:hypothetical protein
VVDVNLFVVSCIKESSSVFLKKGSEFRVPFIHDALMPVGRIQSRALPDYWGTIIYILSLKNMNSFQNRLELRE